MDRRADSRRLVCVPAFVSDDRKTRFVALLLDASTTGARLRTKLELRVDEVVQLALHLDPNAPPRVAIARVVRVQPLGPEESTYRFEVGARFEPPLTQHADEIRSLSERQKRLGVVKR